MGASSVILIRLLTIAGRMRRGVHGRSDLICGEMYAILPPGSFYI